MTLTYGYAIALGVAKRLIEGDAMCRLRAVCPIHDEPLILAEPPRCARCVAALELPPSLDALTLRAAESRQREVRAQQERRHA